MHKCAHFDHAKAPLYGFKPMAQISSNIPVQNGYQPHNGNRSSAWANFTPTSDWNRPHGRIRNVLATDLSWMM
jgi:hypothetical protein